VFGWKSQNIFMGLGGTIKYNTIILYVILTEFAAWTVNMCLLVCTGNGAVFGYVMNYVTQNLSDMVGT